MKNNENSRFVIISGCSSGGKSSILSRLRQKGFNTIEEPGRRIVSQETQSSGAALPWINLEAFARRAIALSKEDLESAQKYSGLVFFDRGLIDAAVALETATNIPVSITLKKTPRFYHKVFLTPPWQKIYITDSERRHSFDDAVREYERLIETYDKLGYSIVVLPKTTITCRIDFLLEHLEHAIS